MKTCMFFRSLVLLFSLGLIVGCAGPIKKLPIKMVDKETGQLMDGYMATTTTGDHLDRSSSITQLGIDTGRKDAEGKPVLKQVSSDLTTGPTVGGQALVGAVAGSVPAAIQASAARSTAKTKSEALIESTRCPDGTTLCHSSVISVDGSYAAAGSTSESAAQAAGTGNASSSAVLGGGCPSGNCVAVPMD